MEELQIIFVITLRLQVTQTFIIVIRIKLFQPEKKKQSAQKESHKSTDV